MDNVDSAKELPTVLSFCSGYGGIERGLDLAGFKHRTVAYVEIEAYAIANLANKMEAGKLLPAPIWSNLKTLPVQPFRDKVDLITGGYPCQPFSAAGKRLGEEDPRHLWPYIRRHIEAIRPVRCFFENVEGHISLGLREVISDLESLGYKVAWGIFSAREVGAPHQRKRVYILAHSISAGAGNIGRAFTNEGWESSASGSEVVRQAHRSELSDRIESASENGACKLADSNDSRRKQSNQKDEGQSSEQLNCRSFQSGSIADTDSKGLERGLQRSVFDSQRRKEQKIRRASQCGNRGSWNGHSGWSSEPRLGRVVDGCADRVDRIRLLGNGVVPQTAAKAWITLNEQLEE